jgi:bacillithiol biosynthesis cysteine-adding enzyme BshC
VHAAIDMRRFSWIRPLVTAYSSDFAGVADLFAGDPAAPEAWTRTIGRVQRASHSRGAIERVASAQLERRSAPPEARAAALRLASPETVVVITGQQAGLFGGPLYTLLKAVTAIQLARRVEREHHVAAVPLFWVDSEDHDWDEVRTATVLDAEMAPVSIAAGDIPGAGRLPVSSLVLDAGITASLAGLERSLAPTEFTADVRALLGRHYRPGARVADAFAGVVDELLGGHGLVVFDGADAGAKALVADVFARELAEPGLTARLARDAGARMKQRGHEPQVEPGEDSVALFYVDQSGRRAIRRHGADFTIGDTAWTADALRAEAAAHPERFSPNVLLRPIVQDQLFPTVCYVAGPAELAYQAQLGEVYRAFGVEAPLLYSRASATLVDPAGLRFLDRSQLPFEALHARDDSALNRLLASQIPPDVDRAIEETDRLIAERGAALKEVAARVDPTLAGAVDTTRDRMRETLASLHGKIVQALKRKDDTLRRQFHRTRALAFPDGQPQERAVSVPFFLNRYGVRAADRLLQTLPLDTSQHYLIAL